MNYRDNETNKGRTWSQDEKDDLLKELINKIPINEIAEVHKRSVRSVECQGLNLIVKMLDHKSMDEVVEKFGFSKNKIEEWIEELDYKKKQSEL